MNILENYKKTEFFQMMRMLDTKKVHLKASHDLQFSPREIKNVEIQKNINGHIEAIYLTVAFIGIAGVQGGLPLHYTELLLQQSRYHHTALADFLDLFHHRSIELFYLSWEKHQFYVGVEKAKKSQKIDLFTRMLKSLTGMSADLFHAGHYANPKRSAMALSQILSHYFAISVKVLEWQGEWLVLSDDKCTALNTHNQNNRLGINMIAGKKIWSAQHKVRIQLNLSQKKQLVLFNPNGKAFHQLCEMTREFIGPALKFDVQLIVKSKAVSHFQLNKKHPTHLGWDIWFKSDHMPDELNDIVLKEEKLYEPC
jgi:type VI secretion system protein ImpH